MYWNFNSPDDSTEIGVHPLSPKKNSIKAPFDNGFSHPTSVSIGSAMLISKFLIIFIFFFYDCNDPEALSADNRALTLVHIAAVSSVPAKSATAVAINTPPLAEVEALGNEYAGGMSGLLLKLLYEPLVAKVAKVGKSVMFDFV